MASDPNTPTTTAPLLVVRHERDWILIQILGERCGINLPSAIVHPEVAK